jgi:hypothetical protein
MTSAASRLARRALHSPFIGVLFVVAQFLSLAWADDVLDSAKSRMTGVYTLQQWDKDDVSYVPPQVDGRFVLFNGVIMTILYNRMQSATQVSSVFVGKYELSAARFAYAYDEFSVVTESADAKSVSHKPLWEGMRGFTVSVADDVVRLREENGTREFVFANDELNYFEKGKLLRKWRRTADR